MLSVIWREYYKCSLTFREFTRYEIHSRMEHGSCTMGTRIEPYSRVYASLNFSFFSFTPKNPSNFLIITDLRTHRASPIPIREFEADLKFDLEVVIPEKLGGLSFPFKLCFRVLNACQHQDNISSQVGPSEALKLLDGIHGILAVLDSGPKYLISKPTYYLLCWLKWQLEVSSQEAGTTKRSTFLFWCCFVGWE